MTSKQLAPVYILNYDHFGYVLWGEDNIRSVIDEETDRLAQYPEFAIGWDSEAYTYDYLARHRPQLLEHMKEALAAYPGRLGVGTCTYGQPLSRFINEESNVRQLTLALDCLERHFGVTKQTYLMSEHAFHAQLPQLLKQCGYRGAILRTHFMMYGHTPAVDAPVVEWVGLDGTSLPAVPMYEEQPHPVPDVQAQPMPFGSVTLDGFILTDYDGRATLNVFRERFGGRIRPLVASRADDPRQREELIEAHHDDPNYRWMLAEDIFDVLPRPVVRLEAAPTDYGVRMPWGFCGNWIWNESRRAEVNVLTAERLNAIAVALGGADMAAPLARAWRALLAAQHHDIQIVGLESAAAAYLAQANADAEEIVARQFAAVAPRIGHDSHPRTVAFNPLPWARTAQIHTSSGVFDCPLPALGFAEVEDVHRVPGGKIVLEDAARRIRTPFYDVRLADEGGIASLGDAQGRVLWGGWQDNGRLSGLVDGEMQYSRASSVDVTAGGGCVTVAEKGLIGSIPYQSEWTFHAHSPLIDWKGRLEPCGEKIGQLSDDETDSLAAFEHLPKICLRLAPRLQEPIVGVEDHPFAVTTAAPRCLQGVYWTALADAQGGLAVFNRGLMGTLLDPQGHVAIPLAFSMFYKWNTIWMDGEYDYQLGLLPFTGRWQDNDLHRKALEYNFPCVTQRVNEGSDMLGASWSPVTNLTGDAVMSALFTADGQTYARFYEHRGVPTEMAFDWLGAPACFEDVDLRLRPVTPLGSALALAPWQVRTVRLTRPVPGKRYPVDHGPLRKRQAHGDWQRTKWFWGPQAIFAHEFEES